MTQYINKDALVAEIERILSIYTKRYDELAKYEVWVTAKEIEHRIQGLKEALSILDTLEVKEIGVDLGDPKGDKSVKYVIDTKTLEVKEVDLDGERRKYLTEHFNVYEDGLLQSKRSNLPLDTLDVIKIANYFFELGLKAQKGE